MVEPKVSVLLPLRNAAAHLEECLESLRAQTLQGVQIVAVNHGSTDATAAILAQVPELTVLTQGEGSLLDALNTGLRACEAPYVARMDGDDRCLPRRLQSQAAYLDAHPEIALCGTQVRYFAEGAVSAGYRDYEAWANALCEPTDIARELFVECPLPHPTWMFRRDAIRALGGYQDESLPEDYHLLLRCAAAGLGLAKVPEVLLQWREHPERHSRTHERYQRHAFFRLKAKFLDRLILKGRPACIWGAGKRARLLVRAMQEEGIRVEWCVGIAEDDESGPTEVHGVPVIRPEQVPAQWLGPLLACVGSPGVKPELRAWMREHDKIEGKDWFFAS